MLWLHNNSPEVYTWDRVRILSSLYFFIRGEQYMEIERKVRKAGNSLGVTIPVSMLKEVGIKEGDVVYISLENNSIVIRSDKMKEDNDKFKQDVLKIIEEYMKDKDKEC